MTGLSFGLLLLSGFLGLSLTVGLANRRLAPLPQYGPIELMAKQPQWRRTMIWHGLILLLLIVAWPVGCALWLTDRVASGVLFYCLVLGTLAIFQLVRAAFELLQGLSVTVNPGRRTVVYPDLVLKDHQLKRLYQYGDEVESAGQYRLVGTLLTLLVGALIMVVSA